MCPQPDMPGLWRSWSRQVQAHSSVSGRRVPAHGGGEFSQGM